MFFRKKTYSLEELIQGCIANDRRCQQMLYDMFFDTLCKIGFTYTKDENDVLSIVNDGFLKAFQNIHTFQHKGSFEGWLKRIMYHCVMDHFRYKDKKLAFLQPMDVLPETASSDNILQELILAEMLEFLDQLPENSAKALRLFAIEGYSHADIGKEMNISEGTSRWHVAQARNILKEKLKSYVQDSPKIQWS